MQLQEVLATESSVNISSPEWQRALRQLHIQMPIDVDKLDYSKCIPCKFTLLGGRNDVKISERPGYFISSKSGVLIVCISTTDMPLTIFVDKKQIRVVQHESKFMKSAIIVKTNEDTYSFKAPKKVGEEIDKELNKMRVTH